MIDREVLIAHTNEIMEILGQPYEDVISDKGLLEANKKRNRDLTELLKQQKRALDFMSGEKIEPVHHIAEATLIAVGQTAEPGPAEPDPMTGQPR